jgi:mannose-6-phosphate isomerase-like protein (cupin superfamily)
MSKRFDTSFPGGLLTQKVMPNGETRTRLKFKTGLISTVTQMPEWKWEDGIPWQEAHFHKGLTERYVVLSGWMAYVLEVVPAGYTPHQVRAGELITFGSGQEHLILLSPGAVVLTTLMGNPVGNPERENQDWWPAVRSDYGRVTATFTRSDLYFAEERRNRQD